MITEEPKAHHSVGAGAGVSGPASAPCHCLSLLALLSEVSLQLGVGRLGLKKDDFILFFPPGWITLEIFLVMRLHELMWEDLPRSHVMHL